MLGGLAAVATVQTAANASLAASLTRETTANTALNDANGQLTKSRAAVEARYKLATDAIKTFHTGVSEDFLLKEEEFKELRDRLLKSAADFYGKLGALLGKETDIGSRRALAQSSFELADLTAKVGRNEDALAAHRAVLAAREALAAEPEAGALAKVDVGRSLIAVAGLLEATGKTDEALASYRRSESLLAGPAGTDPSARAALAVCRMQMGWLLKTTGKSEHALAALRLARADQEALAAAHEASGDARYELADTVARMGVLMEAGKPADAEAEYRRALEIYQKLADDYPAVTKFRNRLARTHGNLGYLADPGKPAESEAEYRKCLAIYQKLADDHPADTCWRGWLLARHFDLVILLSGTGKPAEAEAEYRKALEIWQKLVDDNPSPIDFRFDLSNAYLRLAALQAWFGQDKEFSSTCEKLLSLAQNTEDSWLADKAAKCCSLRQADAKRCEGALVLARRAVEHGKGSRWMVYFEMALGMAEYRSGHFAEAEVALTTAMNNPGKNNTVSSTSAFYRAMGLFRQGKTDLARKLATDAAAQMKPLPVDEQKPLLSGADNDDLIMWLAYKEAKGMIQFDATPAVAAQHHTK